MDIPVISINTDTYDDVPYYHFELTDGKIIRYGNSFLDYSGEYFSGTEEYPEEIVFNEKIFILFDDFCYEFESSEYIVTIYYYYSYENDSELYDYLVCVHNSNYELLKRYEFNGFMNFKCRVDIIDNYLFVYSKPLMTIYNILTGQQQYTQHFHEKIIMNWHPEHKILIIHDIFEYKDGYHKEFYSSTVFNLSNKIDNETITRYKDKYVYILDNFYIIKDREVETFYFIPNKNPKNITRNHFWIKEYNELVNSLKILSTIDNSIYGINEINENNIEKYQQILSDTRYEMVGYLKYLENKMNTDFILLTNDECQIILDWLNIQYDKDKIIGFNGYVWYCISDREDCHKFGITILGDMLRVLKLKKEPERFIEMIKLIQNMKFN